MDKFISKVTATNFKGRNFCYELGALTAIIGNNMTGKSAVRDALGIAVLGYSPKHGKQVGATWGFAGARAGATSLQVSCDFSDGKLVTHTIQMKKGKLSLDSTGGPFPLVPPVLMDVRNEFLAKSGPAKIKFIFEQIDLSAMGYTTEMVTARLKKDVKVKDVTEASEAELASIIEDVEALGQDRDELNRTVQEWLNAVISRIKDACDAAEAVVADMEGMIQGTTQLKSQEGLTTHGNVEAELATARTELQTAVTNKQVADKQASEYVRKTSERDRLTKSLEGSELLVQQLTEAEKQHAEQLETLQRYHSKTPDLFPSHASAETNRQLAAHSADTLTQDIASARAKLETDLQADRCPHCKSKGKGWKDSLRESVGEEIAAMQVNLDSFIKQRDSYALAVTTIKAELDKAQAEDKLVDELRAKNFNLGKTIREQRAMNDRNTNDRAKLATLQDIANGVPEGKLAALRTAVEAAQVRVRDLEAADRQRVASMQDAKRAEQARQTFDEKKVQIEVKKLSLKVLAALTAEMMQAAYVGFMDKVNMFTDGIMPARLEYRDGDIGYYHGATFVTLDYFSGTEEMLTLIGLSVALTQASPFKIVFVDEWLRDYSNRIKVAKRLTDLIASGVIHQAVIIDTEETDYVDFGYTIVRL